MREPVEGGIHTSQAARIAIKEPECALGSVEIAGPALERHCFRLLILLPDVR